MKTGLIVLIVVVVLILLALALLLPRLRAQTAEKKRERELRERRTEVAEAHRGEADVRSSEADRAALRAREQRAEADVAEKQAEAARAEANLHRERADLSERGLADDELGLDDRGTTGTTGARSVEGTADRPSGGRERLFDRDSRQRDADYDTREVTETREVIDDSDRPR